ncbi:MAG: hypothetical protein IT169_10780 [Bryobacterales bacterium]|nr:hypothetical protein [Bryobacterales bacterium]
MRLVEHALEIDDHPGVLIALNVAETRRGFTGQYGRCRLCRRTRGRKPRNRLRGLEEHFVPRNRIHGYIMPP